MKSLTEALIFFFLGLSLVAGRTAFAQDTSKKDSLIFQAEKSNNDSSRVYLLVAASKEFVQNDILESLHFGEQALAVAENTKSSKLISYALFNLGATLYQQGLLQLSIPYFLRYLEINQAKNDQKAIAYAMTNIGAIYLKINNNEEAERYFGRALKIFETIYAERSNPGKEIISIYNNLGIIAKRRKESEKAIRYYKDGITLARNTPKTKPELGNLLNNLGTIHLEEGRFELAKPYLLEAFELRKSREDHLGQMKSYLTIGSFHEKQDQNELAFSFYYKALNLAKTAGAISTEAETQKAIFELYQKEAQYDSALKYHLIFSQLQGKLNQETALKELRQFEISSRFEEREKILQEESKRKEIQYQLMGVILLLTSIILGLLFFLSNNRGKRLRLEKENLLLQSQNLNSEQARTKQELDIRNKELTTVAIYQIQKNELITEVIENLKTIKPELADKTLINEALSDLKKIQNLSAWNEFELRFQQVHEGFYKRLNELFPALSINERRLCAFIKLNLTTKEISKITGQSPRSIEVARTRLRKKLNLTNSDTSLTEFVTSI